MQVHRLWLRNFRSYHELEVAFPPGLTALLGSNGQGKTNLLEAIAWLATASSFRGAAGEALVRRGAEQAIVRAEIEQHGRESLVEVELAAVGRNRLFVNRQRLGTTRELLGAVRTTVFCPDDLELIKGGPDSRRRYLDQTLLALRPSHAALFGDLDRVVRQRNALLRQAGGRLDRDAAFTLDVWDAKLSQAGEAVARLRVDLVDRLRPILQEVYTKVAGVPTEIATAYVSSWPGDDGLASALATARPEDVRRGITTIGPHRDELALAIDGLLARRFGSQGEQRSLALALRLAAHQVVSETVDSHPIVLLDDVFSELDRDRADALLGQLPACQTILTTAMGLPAGAVPDQVLSVVGSVISPVSG